MFRKLRRKIARKVIKKAVKSYVKKKLAEAGMAEKKADSGQKA